MPRASFVVVAYNRPEALRTCLSSIIQQSEKDWEAIVVDNSYEGDFVDKNRELTEMDSRISYLNTSSQTVIPGPHIRCLYTATEIGVEQTKSDWITIPNDDSYYVPWFLERMLKKAEESDWEFIYCDVVLGGPVQHHPMIVSPRECCIDKTCFLVKKKWFDGFKDKWVNYHCADGRMIEDLVRRGVRHGRLDQLLVVHN